MATPRFEKILLDLCCLQCFLFLPGLLKRGGAVQRAVSEV